MTKLFGFLVLLVAFLPTFVSLNSHAYTNPLQITEINFDGFAGNGSDKWIEIGNFGTEPVDLSGYFIRTNSSKDIALKSYILEPKQVAVIGSTACNTKNCKPNYLDVVDKINLISLSSDNAFIHAELIYNGKVVSGLKEGNARFTSPNSYKTLELVGESYILSSSPFAGGYATPGSFAFATPASTPNQQTNPILITNSTPEINQAPEQIASQPNLIPANLSNQVQPQIAIQPNIIANPVFQNSPEVANTQNRISLPALDLQTQPKLDFGPAPQINFAKIPTASTQLQTQKSNPIAIQTLLLASMIMSRTIQISRQKIGKLQYA
jgi:Lamin Tail Domain